MKEKIYAIPVNDAFDAECECPVCIMYKTLEDNAIEYTMGPSYMEDDVRAETDKLGFCQKHVKMLYAQENRLGMALVMKTNFDKTINDIKKLLDKPLKQTSFFKKNEEKSPLLEHLEKINNSCFVCNRINNVFNRYIDTILMLWQETSDFKDKYSKSKGFCTPHYQAIISAASDKLRGKTLEEFLSITHRLYIENMERVRDDLEWFINKFDYKYKDEPWKNAKDSVIRSITKSNCILDVSEK